MLSLHLRSGWERDIVYPRQSKFCTENGMNCCEAVAIFASQCSATEWSTMDFWILCIVGYPKCHGFYLLWAFSCCGMLCRILRCHEKNGLLIVAYIDHKRHCSKMMFPPIAMNFFHCELLFHLVVCAMELWAWSLWFWCAVERGWRPSKMMVPSLSQIDLDGIYLLTLNEIHTPWRTVMS